MKLGNRLVLSALFAAVHAPLFAVIQIQSLSPSIASPQPLGTRITWTAVAADSNPGPLTFQFNVIYPSGASSMVVDFNLGTFHSGLWTSQPFTWATIASEGIYRVQVVAKDFASGETQTGTMSYTLTSLANGQAKVTTIANPLVALYSAPPCPAGSTMQAVFRIAAGGPLNGSDWKPCNGSTSMNFYIAGLQPSTAYIANYQVQTGTTIVPGSQVLGFTTGPLPANIQFPAFTQIFSPGPKTDIAQAVILHSMVPGTNEPFNFPVATDLSGNIIWYDKANGLVLTRPLANGMMLGIQNGPAWNSFTNVLQQVVEIDLAGNIIHQSNTGVIQQQLLALGATDAGSCMAVPNPPPIGAACLSNFSHEVTRLPNGYTAVLAAIEKIFPPGTQGSTSPLPVDILGDLVVILDSNWQAVWYWDSFDPAEGGNGYGNLPVSRTALRGETCVSLSNFCPPIFLLSDNTAPAANEWLHGNCISYMASSGDLLVSMRDQDWVIKLDYKDGTGNGNILWRMGNGGDFTFENIDNDPWPWFSGQHDVLLQNNFTGPLTVFDDGNSRLAPPPLGLGTNCSNDCTSRGMSLTLDEQAMTVTPLLSQNLNVFSFALGSAQLLSNGSYYFLPGLVQNAYSYSTEVLPTSGTTEGKIIYELQGPVSYRGFRMGSMYNTVPGSTSSDPPANLAKCGGDGQSTTTGQPFAVALQVCLTDAGGHPLSGWPVTFSVSSAANGASGTFSATPPMPVVTDASGTASAPILTANAIGGTFTVTASVQGLTVTFSLTNIGYALASSSATVGSAAGSGTVLLISNGPWTASSNAPWLQLTPGSTSGAGSALIQYSFNANTNPGAQSGTLTIAGLTYTVTQAGAAYIPVYPVSTLLSRGLNHPQGVTVDGQGNVYVADTVNNVIREWNPGTQQTTLSVTGLNNPVAVAVDGHGNIYIADSGYHAIEGYNTITQKLTTLVPGLGKPGGVAVDSLGNVYFSDSANNLIGEWNASNQQLTTLVNSGLSNPTGVEVDAEGNVFFADSGNNSIKEWLVTSGQVTTVVSSGLDVPTGVAVDGQDNIYIADAGDNAIKEWTAGNQQVVTLAFRGLNSPMGVAVDAQGNLYIADTNDNAIDKLTPAYLALSATSLTEGTAQGTDSLTAQVLPVSVPVTASIEQPWLSITGINGGVVGLSFTTNTTGANRTARVTITGFPVTVTQTGDAAANLTKCGGDNQSTAVGQPFATALQVCLTDSGGNPLAGWPVTFRVMPAPHGAGATFSGTPPMPVLTDASGTATAPALTANMIAGAFMVTANVTTLSQTFTLISSVYSLGAPSTLVAKTTGRGSVLLVAGGPWTASSNTPWLNLSPSTTSGIGNAVIQFSYAANAEANSRIGTLSISGLTFTVTQAGASFASVGLLTTLLSSGLQSPFAVAVDGAGNIYIADTGKNSIDEANAATQKVSTLVSGLNGPTGVAVDTQGNVYFADSKNNAIKEFIPSQDLVIPLVSTGLTRPIGVAVDSRGNVYFSDSGHNAVKLWIAATSKVVTLVQTGLSSPLGVAVDAQGNVYIADNGNKQIKEWNPAGKTVATLISTGLNNPYGIAVDGDGNVYVADVDDNAIKEWSPASQALRTLVSNGVTGPAGVAVDAQGNIYIADTGDNSVKKYTATYFSWDAASRTEGAAAGSDSVSYQVLPANLPVRATSSQPWLTITGAAGGAVSFSFAANTSANSRTARITVLGQPLTVTQSGDNAAAIVNVAGNGQTTPVLQPFGTPLKVRVTDAASNGIQGAAVTFTVIPGSSGAGATFSSTPPMPAITDASGYAVAPTLTANSIEGSFTVVAAVGNLTTVFGLKN